MLFVAAKTVSIPHCRKRKKVVCCAIEQATCVQTTKKKGKKKRRGSCKNKMATYSLRKSVLMQHALSPPRIQGGTPFSAFLCPLIRVSKRLGKQFRRSSVLFFFQSIHSFRFFFQRCILISNAAHHIVACQLCNYPSKLRRTAEAVHNLFSNDSFTFCGFDGTSRLPGKLVQASFEHGLPESLVRDLGNYRVFVLVRKTLEDLDFLDLFLSIMRDALALDIEVCTSNNLSGIFDCMD
jgi:hypothetical protein